MSPVAPLLASGTTVSPSLIADASGELFAATLNPDPPHAQTAPSVTIPEMSRRFRKGIKN
jgi:hypothetical protein